MSISRRFFLRGAAGAAAAAPIALPMAIQESQNELTRAAMGYGLSGGMSIAEHGLPSVGEELNRLNPIVMAARALLETRERERQTNIAYRINGLEPDIAALHSITPAAKIRMQRNRDYEAMSFLQKLRKEAWG